MKKLLFVALAAFFSSYTQAQFWKISDVQKIGGTVNQAESEESYPVFSKDSSRLYFVRLFDKSNEGGGIDQDIWYSEHTGVNSYSDCEPLKRLNNKFNNAIAGISSDGNSMYLLNAYEGKKDMVKGLAVSRLENGSWSTPEKVEIPGLDIEGEFYGFFVSGDEKTIIISYNGEGSIGEEDLYVSQKSGETWSKPVHMGNKINSAGFEISPFLNPTKDTLFFSSNGHGGEGDADIFYSVRKSSWSDWSTPVNLGNVINSPKFDAYFDYSNNRAYWSSNRDGEYSDIYTAAILTPPPLSIDVAKTDVTVHKGTDGTTDLTVNGGVAPFTYKWSNGGATEDLSGLPTGQYDVTVTDAIGQIAEAGVYVDEPPMKIEPVDVVIYENFNFEHYFGYNKNKLNVKRGDLKKYLSDVEKQLKKGRKSVTIKVDASASNVPTQSFASNEKLAEARANNIKYDIVDYFEKKGLGQQVLVTIVSSKVQGPQYEDDASNRDKYSPYQFVKLSME